ncbi:hypothetical protein, partial [uncultured Prevotella sp.]|uniref:hypothetical protein n=1 Tax=uncultured Prevotella sp. TaxID=159272 RepID=UPI0026DCBAB8
LIRNSPLLLIKSQTKSTLLKNKIQASPNDRFGFIVPHLESTCAAKYHSIILGRRQASKAL